MLKIISVFCFMSVRWWQMWSKCPNRRKTMHSWISNFDGYDKLRKNYYRPIANMITIYCYCSPVQNSPPQHRDVSSRILFFCKFAKQFSNKLFLLCCIASKYVSDVLCSCLPRLFFYAHFGNFVACLFAS